MQRYGEERSARHACNNGTIHADVVSGGCAQPLSGPDKQFVGSVQGAATGAGAGAVTGAQMSAGTGLGAVVGAGVGAIVGGVQGVIQDQQEEDLLRVAAETRQERSVAFVHEVLAEHYKLRLALHPTRDIYPADIFFDGDSSKLKPSAVLVVHEIARLNRRRLPWSRLVIAAYAKASDVESAYGKRLCERRARAIGDHFVAAGIEPRRIETRVVLLSEPLVIDPDDSPGRYNQAIELIPIDR